MAFFIPASDRLDTLHRTPSAQTMVPRPASAALEPACAPRVRRIEPIFLTGQSTHRTVSALTTVIVGSARRLLD